MKPKTWRKNKICSKDIDSFIVYIITEDIYVDITKAVEIKSDTSTQKLERSLPRGNWIKER